MNSFSEEEAEVFPILLKLQLPQDWGPMLCCEVCSQLLCGCHLEERNWRPLSLGHEGVEKV